mmetsp:Transcript_45048/g.107032  ORF Transcript_45048/g.107032 Transcript_45048/m.107032 type:complete len:281 (-) Transcript_45048:134-976(-)
MYGSNARPQMASIISAPRASTRSLPPCSRSMSADIESRSYMNNLQALAYESAACEITHALKVPSLVELEPNAATTRAKALKSLEATSSTSRMACAFASFCSSLKFPMMTLATSTKIRKFTEDRMAFPVCLIMAAILRIIAAGLKPAVASDPSLAEFHQTASNVPDSPATIAKYLKTVKTSSSAMICEKVSKPKDWPPFMTALYLRKNCPAARWTSLSCGSSIARELDSSASRSKTTVGFGSKFATNEDPSCSSPSLASSFLILCTTSPNFRCIRKGNTVN